MLSFITSLIFISALKISHVELNQKPTFSYVIITLSSMKFDFEQKILNGNIIVIIPSAQILPRREIIWEKDRYFRKVNFSEVVEGERKSAMISVYLKREDLKWHITKSGSSIIIFAGRDIPFIEKRDIEEYMRTSVETRNYGAIDILFDFARSEDREISAKALFYIAEMLSAMGIETREVTTLLKSANYYSNAAKKFFDIGNVKDAADLKYRSSRIFRISGFYPESKFQAESGMRYLEPRENSFEKIENKEDLEVRMVCSQALALVGMNKAGEAANVMEKVKIEGKKLSDETFNCYWGAMGAIEFERGNYENSAEFISYISDRFIQYDPVILPRYIRALIRTNRGYLARRYIGFMINSLLPEQKPEAYLLLSEILFQDKDYKNSLKFIYRILREYPGTRWEIRARLFAVLNRDKYSETIKELPKSDIPADDPVSLPLPNLRFIITNFLSPESQIALREYLKILAQKIGTENVDEVQRDLNFLKEVIPTIRTLRTPPDVSIEISESMYDVLKRLYDNGYKIRAFSFYVDNKDLLPPRYVKDYSFVDQIYREFGQTDDVYFELAQVEILLEESRCSEAYDKIKKIQNKIEPADYSASIVKIALCFFSKKDPMFKELCAQNIEDLESICYPKEMTPVERINQIVEEIIKEYKDASRELREKLKK
ncbi:MAG: hypothetical protein NZ927_05480 [Candidatus Calescibacterium sp.]|nr:hypothetical protein [Candidatus Calescibacterium sp.]MDW8086888.1 hypothetical protein [Candidatus Calescibacterium sp.]